MAMAACSAIAGRRWPPFVKAKARSLLEAIRHRVVAAVNREEAMQRDAVLVTGATGFIGFHVARQLPSQGRAAFGIDSINQYDDPKAEGGPPGSLERQSQLR